MMEVLHADLKRASNTTTKKPYDMLREMMKQNEALTRSVLAVQGW